MKIDETATFRNQSPINIEQTRMMQPKNRGFILVTVLEVSQDCATLGGFETAHEDVNQFLTFV